MLQMSRLTVKLTIVTLIYIDVIEPEKLNEPAAKVKLGRVILLKFGRFLGQPGLGQGLLDYI